MELFVWIIGAAVVLFLGWFFLKTALGFLVNPKTSGRIYFRKELEKAGISPSNLGDDCVDDLFTNVYQIAEATSKIQGKNFRTEMVDYIDITVRQITNFFHAVETNRFQRGMYGNLDPVEEILLKYGHLEEK